MILAWIRLEEALAKALFSMAIMIRPGATNSAKGVPCSGGRAPCSATTKTSIYKRVVTTGAATVWAPTFQNRRTSRR